MPSPKTKVRPIFWERGRRKDQIMKGRVVRMTMSVEMLYTALESQKAVTLMQWG